MATRRSNGEGTAPRKRADGRWHIRIRTTQTATGTPTRKDLYGKTRAEVVAKARAYRKQLDEGVFAGTGSQTLHQWAEYWLEDIQAAKVRPQTLAGYRGYLERWTYTTPIARKPLDRIKPADIEHIYTRMRACGLKESTVAHMHRVLSMCFKAAVTNDILLRSPLDRVTKPQIEKFNPVVLSPEQARQMVQALKNDDKWGATHTLNLTLGLRQGERLGLIWDDVNLDAGTLRVERTIVMKLWEHGCTHSGRQPTCGRKNGGDCPQRHNGGFVMGPPKNRAGTRTIPLPNQLVDILKHHKVQQRRRQLEAGTRWVGAIDAAGKKWDLVFTNSRGQLIRPNEDWKAWNSFTINQGVKGMRVHDARHTAATVLLSMGVSPQVTMDIMGWSSPSMLARYQHVLDEMRREATDKIASALF